jgi:hypothetical protein
MLRFLNMAYLEAVDIGGGGGGRECAQEDVACDGSLCVCKQLNACGLQAS